MPARYCVMNNYEDLPQVIPSEVDIAIDPVFFAGLDGMISAFAAHEGVQVVQKIWHGTRKCAYILATDAPRAFLQLDFFVEFSIKHCPNLISNDDLLNDRQPYRNFYIPRPDVERLFTVMRRLFKDDWEVRHCDRVCELGGRISGEAWLPARFAWLQNSFDLAVAGDVETLASQRAAHWAKLKQTAKNGLSPLAKWRNLGWQSRRGVARLGDETGNLSLVFGEIAGEADAVSALGMAFHRQLTIDEAWLEKRGKGGFPGGMLALIARLKLLKQRKGLVLVRVGPRTPRARKLAAQLRRFGLIDQILLAEGEEEARAWGAPLVEVKDGSELIEAILATQTAKTKIALARKWTQTSRRADG